MHGKVEVWHHVSEFKSTLLLMLSPQVLTHALTLMHGGVLVVQVLSILNVLLRVWIRIRIVGLLSAWQRLVAW